MNEFSIPWIKTYDFFNWNSKGRLPNHKKKMTQYNIQNMLLRTSRMFSWSGLPYTIPQRFLELVLQSWGYVGFIKNNDEYYACWGTLGGSPNYNYMPSKMIISNPYISKNGIFKEYNIYGDKKDIVVIPNDTLYRGIMPILGFHSELNTEIQLTKRAIIINHRMPNVLTASDNNAKKDIDDFINDLEDGELTSIFDKNYMKKIESLPYGEGRSANLITQVIEMEQYQKASLFNDLGLQANYNMKRETLTSSENLLNIDALLPLCDDMLEMRQRGCDELNEVFGLNISVDFSSSWKMLRDNLETEKLKSVNDVVNNIPQTKEVQSTEQNNTIKSTEQDNIIQSTEQDNQLEVNDDKNYVVSNDLSYKDTIDKSIQNISENIIEIIEDVVKEDLKEGENNEIVSID